MKKIIAVLTAIVCMWTILPVNTRALITSSKIYSNNIHEHVYATTSKVSNSYMCVNPDGTISRIENYGDVILNEKYNSKFKITSQSTIPFELTKFGGFYSGTNYNYFVFGQDNPAHDNKREVIRIVKYTKNWQRAGVISVTNCNTEVPFYLCNTSFAENGNMLIIRCGHKTYDGKQGTMNIEVRTDNNSIVAMTPYLTGNTAGNVENSGASYIDAYNGVVTIAEKSLTNPAALLMTKYSGAMGATNFQCGATAFSALGNTDKLTASIPEFTLGGYGTNASYSIAVGNSQPMDGTSPNNNIVVVAAPKANFNKASTTVSYLTGFAQGSTMTVTTPYLVKINDNLFAILWEQRDGYSDMCATYYTFIDGTGRRLTDNKSVSGCLSDCQPVLYGSNIVWFTTNGANVSIYSIPVSVKSQSNVYASTQTTTKNDYSKIYDYNYYMSKYPDVRVLYSNNEAGALQHFLTTGIAEGRQGCENFNVSIYAQNYADLRASFGGNYKAYYMHYMNYGFAEGRNGKTKIKK